MSTVSIAQIPEHVFTKARAQIAPALGMVGWWMLCVTYPVLAGVLGALYGCIVGTTSGIAAGITEAKTDLERLAAWMVKR